MLIEAFPTVETCNNHSGSVGPGGLRPRRCNTLFAIQHPQNAVGIADIRRMLHVSEGIVTRVLVSHPSQQAYLSFWQPGCALVRSDTGRQQRKMPCGFQILQDKLICKSHKGLRAFTVTVTSWKALQ